MLRTNFYCKKKCGDPDFSIEDWNKQHQQCIFSFFYFEMSKLIRTFVKKIAYTT